MQGYEEAIALGNCQQAQPLAVENGYAHSSQCLQGFCDACELECLSVPYRLSAYSESACLGSNPSPATNSPVVTIRASRRQIVT